MSDTGESRLGEEIAGYRIESVLGRAGTGVLYLAEDTRLKRKVALKLVALDLAADERIRERFLREAKLAASLEHPHILPLYEVGEADGLLFIAMPYVEGTDLASLLAGEGRLEPERTLLIVSQLASALDTARWSRGLVHGSLKPSNVLVVPGADTASGERVFLLGFGLRQELPAGATLAEAAQHFGTIDYLAPEQIEGRPASPHSDIYALGCLLFHCLSGEPPFQGDSAEALLKAQLHAQPPSLRRSWPELPAAIDRVLQKALAKWPEERYSTCEELAASVQAALAPGGEQSERPPREERLSPVGLPPRHELAAPEETPPAREPPGASLLAPDTWAQRLRTSRGKSIAAIIALVALLAALAAGAIWLSGRDTGAVSSATPAPPEGETPNEVAVDEGEASAEPPAAAPVAAEPTPVVSPPGSLVRIDARTGEILARVPIPLPTLLAADGRSVWALGDGGTALVHIEPATHAITGIFDAVGGGEEAATQLAVAGGNVWFGDGGVLRLAPGESVAELVELVSFISPSGGPLYIASAPIAAAGSLWVSAFPQGHSSPDLYRVDPATERVIARIDGVGEVVASGSGFLWAHDLNIQPEALALVRIDTETHATVPIGTLDFQWADFTVADGAVWASSPQDDTIVRLDPVSGEEKERIRVGPLPGALAAGAGAVWAANSKDGTVTRYDIATDQITTIDVGGTPNDLVVAGDSVWVAVRNEMQESVDGLTAVPSVPEVDYVIDLNTGVMTPLPEAIIRSVAKSGEISRLLPLYAASPDRSLLAYVGIGEEGSLQIFIAGIDGTGVRQLTHDPTGATSPAFSPDGIMIAYQGYGEGGVRNLFVLDVATGESTSITDDVGPDPWVQPSFTPDGSSLLYTGGSNSPGLRTVPVAGGKSTLLFGGGRGGMDGAGNGSLSPDGSLVTMMGNEIGGPGAIRFVANADGTELRSISGELASSNPAGTWSPDGGRIVCSDYEGKDILVVDIATGDVWRVAAGSAAIWLDRHTLLVEVV